MTEKAIDSFSGDYRFLSNFYPSLVIFNGLQFQTVEHAYQAAKSLKYSDQIKIKKAKNPSKAKRLGRSVTIRSDWEEVKEEIMLQLFCQKFGQSPLTHKLLATKNLSIIEGNNWGDTYWGICRGVGKNRLGILLMRVRDEMLNKKAGLGLV